VDGVVSAVIGDRLVVAAVTPLREDESVDLDRVAAVVDADVARGIEGVYVGGSTGEGLLLSEAERAALAAAAVAAADRRVPVIAHVGAMSTAEALRIATAAQEAGVAAISMTPPLYYGYSAADAAAHFRTVADAVDLPFLVYNIPQFTGRDIADGGFDELLAHERVVGIKHTSSNFYGAERLLRHHPDVTVVNGFDETYLAALSVGARGTIGTTTGIQVELFRSLRRRFQAGDVTGARDVQRRINDLIEVLVTVGVFGGAKYLVSKRVPGVGHCRRPLPRLAPEGRDALDRAWETLQEHVATTTAEDAGQ
jgi:N-acetylneuraminate lyase